MKKLLAFVVAAIVALAVVAVVGVRAVRSGGRRPNVLLISLDTTRADRLGCYGGGKRVSPRIDALAAEGILFENAVTPKPLTLPAHSTMMTGKVPPCHGVHDNLSYRLHDANVTLAERLQAAGYRTAAVVGSFILDKKFGLAQGFDFYEDNMGESMKGPEGYAERRADAVTGIALDWLEKNASEPFFLFVHFYDPHDPYEPPGDYASVFADEPYSGEIRYADDHVGKILDRLRALGIYDSTLVIVVGDHGEGLNDHGEVKHGYFIYHSTTHVPLVIKPLGKVAARRVKAKIGVVDVAPTVLSQTHLVPLDYANGEDLTPYFTGDPPPSEEERHLYSESMTATKFGCSALLAVETREWKYIHTAKPELYRLTEDPQEANNAYAANESRGRFMLSKLADLLADCKAAAPARATADVDLEDVRRLRALGYVEGMVREDFSLEDAAKKEDPKDFQGTFRQVEAVEYHLNRGEVAEAKKLCAAAVAQRPDVAYLQSLVGRIAILEKDFPAGIEPLQTALALEPDHADWQKNLGVVLAAVGRVAEAKEHYDAALRLAVTGELGKPGDGEPTIPPGLDDPMVANVYLNRGNMWMRQNDCEAATRDYRVALRIQPDHAATHYRLGVALAACGHAAEAAASLRKAVELDPSDPKAGQELERLGGTTP